MANSRAEFFSKLFLDSQVALRRYVQRLIRSRDNAEEIVQETFLRAYEHGEGHGAPKALLYSIARNLATDRLRHERVAQTETLGDFDVSNVVSDTDSVEAGLLADERTRVLVEAVEHLAPQCRAVFVLKVFHACSYKEISQRLGISTKTVENYLAHGVRETHQRVRRRYKDAEIR